MIKTLNARKLCKMPRHSSDCNQLIKENRQILAVYVIYRHFLMVTLNLLPPCPHSPSLSPVPTRTMKLLNQKIHYVYNAICICSKTICFLTLFLSVRFALWVICSMSHHVLALNICYHSICSIHTCLYLATRPLLIAALGPSRSQNNNYFDPLLQVGLLLQVDLFLQVDLLLQVDHFYKKTYFYK